MNDLSSWRAAAPRGHAPPLPSAIVSLLRSPLKAIRALQRRRRRAAAIAELMQLDDKTLADMGLHRSEIRAAVLEAEHNGGLRRRRCR